ncbi:uncharacterized protein [Dysidea avara]|uniref:uncharacterized protein n=1 Tax=Dysidea avara TaxID=196820 RepID=UPI0033301821
MASQQESFQGDQFTHDVITAHNQYRVKHNTPPLKWSSKAAMAAQRWAEQLAKQNKLQHGDHEGMGQNLAYMSGKPMTGQEATDMWYNEIKDYDFSNPKFTPGTGHFTQVVWADSTEIGVGRATSGGQTFVVANYYPPGNVKGHFEANVQSSQRAPQQTTKSDRKVASQKENTEQEPSAAQAQEPQLDQFTRDVITAHNQYRSKHNAPPLKWSSKAAMAAQRWAEQLAKQNKLQHGDHEGMGQNLAYMSGKPMTGQEATDMWYDEVKKYDFKNPRFTPGTGHFTQVVWVGSKEIGVGRATNGGQTFVVANYYPPGNYQGKYKENVQTLVRG